MAGNWTRPDAFSIFRLQRLVGSAEIDGLRLDLLDTATGTDRLIIQADTGFRLVGFSPFCVNRIREGRTGPRDIGCGHTGTDQSRCRNHR